MVPGQSFMKKQGLKTTEIKQVVVSKVLIFVI